MTTSITPKLPPMPKVGDKIYVPSAYYIDREEDDFHGGIATVSGITEVDNWGYVWIEIAERPLSGYEWRYIGPKQQRLKEEFGNQKAFSKPI